MVGVVDCFSTGLIAAFCSSLDRKVIKSCIDQQALQMPLPIDHQGGLTS